MAKFTIWQVLFFVDSLVVRPSLGELFVNQNPKEVGAPYSPGWILGCAYISCSYGQISISCTILRRSPCPPSRVFFYPFSFALICCIRFLLDWSFRLYHYIIYMLFCCVISILALTKLILMVLFCAAIRRDSVSLLRLSPLLVIITLCRFFTGVSVISNLEGYQDSSKYYSQF